MIQRLPKLLTYRTTCSAKYKKFVKKRFFRKKFNEFVISFTRCNLRFVWLSKIYMVGLLLFLHKSLQFYN